MFHNVINKKISYPAEYGYGLVANKWFFQNFKGRIGLLGASEKIYLIEELMQYQQYQLISHNILKSFYKVMSFLYKLYLKKFMSIWSWKFCLNS